MDLGNISGRTLDLPNKTEVFVVDFLNKRLIVKATIENSTYDPAVFEVIQKGQEELAKIYKQKRQPKRARKSA